MNAPLDTQPTSLHQWNLGAQRQVGDWLLSASYIGNRSVHLWRATELNPAVFSPGATTGTTNQRRVLFRQDPVMGQFYGTIGQLDDTGRGNYHGMLLSAQRRLKGNLSVLSNYTLSQCKSDPATTELTGPTIVDPNNPDADYTYCDADRRQIVNVSVVARTPEFANATMRALLGNWQIAPLVRWQSGNRSSVTTGVDNALSGMGGQRAVQILDDPYGDRTVNNYLNRNAFGSPDPGTYSTLAPNTILNPSQFQNDLAVTRTFRFSDNALQFRWEVFNVVNKANFNGPVTALNSTNFGRILTAGQPRIMQFALKYNF